MLKKIFYSLIILYTLVGFILLPILLKPEIEKAANEALNAKLSLESIYINPFVFKVELSGVKLKDLEDNHLVSFKSLKVDVELYSLFASALHVKSIVLEKPKVSLVHKEDKSFNLATILKPSEDVKEEEKPEEESALPRIIIDKIAIKEGSLAYRDLTQAKEFDFELKDLSFKLQDIDTNDFDSSDGYLRFHTELGDSGVVDIKTKITGLKPLKVKGNIDFKVTKLYKELDYIEDRLGVEVANGAIYFHADYAANIDDLNNTLVDNVSLKLDHFRIKPKAQHNDVLNIGTLHVEGVRVKPFMQDVYVEKVLLDTLKLKASLNKKGVLDWSTWLPKSEKTQDKNKSVTSDEKDAKPWNVLVDKITVAKVSAEFDDATVNPAVKTKLNEFNLQIDKFTPKGDKAFNYDMNLVLNDEFKCSSSGDVRHDVLKINTTLKCREFDILHYKPYIIKAAKKELDENDVDLKNAKLDFSLDAIVSDDEVSLTNTTVVLNKLLINKKSKNKKLLSLKKFQVKTKDLVLKTKQKPLGIHLSKVDIVLGNLAVVDYSLQDAQTHKIDKITLNAKDIDAKEKTWLSYALNIKLNKGGLISSKGKLRHTPLKQKGVFSIKKLSLKEATPYLQESMFVSLNDGFLNLNSKVSYEKSDKKPDLNVDGSLSLESFELSDSRTNNTLLSFAETELKSFNLNLFPSSIYIDEVNLDSFYVDAQIDKNKQMNFAKLSKKKDDANITKVEDTNETTTKKEDKFAFKLMKLHVSNGTANFADYSLPIDFKTSMHNLNGDVYAISNSDGEVSYINIDGEVDEYGSTKIKGSLDTSNIKAYTDIGVSFRNLGLDSYSGYSAQFAGYKIKKGKLFLDLEYKILNSQLQGKNSLIIKQIELGDEIEDENITKLPLGFAIALLEDGDGVIDINMPVEGDMDEPDFKYGALILKTFANLIVKAVASPFKFLGEAMGFNGDELKFIDFEPAKIVILAPQREKLDNIAKMLLKKPKLSLEIETAYDEQKDRYGLKLVKLTKDVLKRSDDKANASITVDVLEDIYEESGASMEKLDALKDELEKKYEKDEIFKVEYEKELFKLTISTKIVDEQELIDLAKKRAKTLKEYLVQNKNIQDSRIVVQEPKMIESELEEMVQVPLNIVVK